jgi:hypothetical protein
MRCLVTVGKHVNNTRAIARKLLGKWVPAVTDTHATVEVLLDYKKWKRCFLCDSCRNIISRVSRVPVRVVCCSVE